MMTEQRLQEIDEGNVPEQRAIDECVTEIRRLRVEVEQAQPPALPPLPSEVQALRDLCPTPWYVEEVRPGYPDEARVYDARHYGVLKPTCDRPDIRRSLADAIVALVNGRHAEAAHQRLKEGHRG